MTKRKRQIRQLAEAVLSRIPALSLAEAHRKGIPASGLITVGDAHRETEHYFTALLDDLEAACAGAKTRAQLMRRFDSVFRRHAKPFSSRLGPLPNESRSTKPKQAANQNYENVN